MSVLPSLLCVSLIALAVARAPPLITLLVVRTEFPVTAGAALRFCLPCGVSHLLTYLLDWIQIAQYIELYESTNLFT